MVTKVLITYTDLEGCSRTDTFFFGLTKSEVAEWEMEVDGGLSAYLEKLQKMAKELSPKDENGKDVEVDPVKARDLTCKISAIVKDIILRSYGEKSEDGRRFIKSKEIANAFYQTDAYSELFMKLMTGGGETLTSFVKAVLPAPPQTDSKAAAWAELSERMKND